MSHTSSRHPSLQHGPADLIDGAWRPLDAHAAGASPLQSFDPAQSDRVIWSGAANPAHVDAAVEAARKALPAWAALPIERRAAVLRRFQEICKTQLKGIGTLLRDEVGKVAWDADAEAGLLGPKVDITLDATEHGALRRVSGFEVGITPSRIGKAWFKPHGVMAVLGPFNFPMHLPNGHIAPALLMGNTIVFKPSDKTPASGQLLAQLYQSAMEAEGLGHMGGVVNLVQGRADAAQRLVRHPELDGILFTGSWPVGRAILEANLDRPGRLCALEMGGNNAAVILPDADLKQAVIECVRSAFITTGQRCTCTRRVLVHREVAPQVIKAICQATSQLIIGHPADQNPVFMGPMISAQARDGVLMAQQNFCRAGAQALVQASAIPEVQGKQGHYLSPAVLTVDRFTTDDGWASAGCDQEVFGPLLRIATVDSLDDAIAQTNATRYGLAASIFTKDEAAIQRFLFEARAGCINVNTGTAGASSKLPFGGLGLSGNHRPAGAFSLDYSAYPVAGMIERADAALVPTGMRFDPAWLH